jgi:hypothetical protein
MLLGLEGNSCKLLFLNYQGGFAPFFYSPNLKSIVTRKNLPNPEGLNVYRNMCG